MRVHATRPGILQGSNVMVWKEKTCRYLSVARIRMLRWMSDKMRKDSATNNITKGKLGLVPVQENMMENFSTYRQREHTFEEWPHAKSNRYVKERECQRELGKDN